MDRILFRTPLAAAIALAGLVSASCAGNTSQASTSVPQTPAPAAQAGGQAGQQGGGGMDESRTVAGGGISVSGWQGRVDANEAARGATVASAKLSGSGNSLSVTTGPAITYWNPANRATGEYTVSATFNEPKYMNLNNHPHPYGIMIGGNDLGTDQQSLLYCAAYGNGNFIVRGFGPAAFQMNGPRGGPGASVNKAAAAGEPVTQQISVSVRNDRVSCSINGQELWSAPKSEVVAAGKLKSTDGIYGVRFAHNTEATVTGLRMTRP